MLEYALGRLVNSDRIVDMVEAVEAGESYTITHDGEPVAVVISVEAHAVLTAAYVLQEARAGNVR